VKLYIAYIYIYSFLYHKPWFGAFAFQIGSSIENKLDIASKREFTVTRIRKSDLYNFLTELVQFRRNVELQIKNSQELIGELQDVDISLPFEQNDTKYNFYLFPILLNSEEKRDKAYDLLKSMNVDTAKLYSMTPTIARQNYGYGSDCPTTEEFANRILTIPNYYSLTQNELSTIIGALKEIGDKL